MNSNEFQAHAEQVERLVEQVSGLKVDDARTAALDLMQALMDLHGAGLTRIVDLLGESESSRKSLAKLGEDPMVCGLMVLYGIHPVSLDDRIKNAVDKARLQVQKQGGRVELLEVSDGLVRVSISSTGNGCHSSPDALKQIVEQSIREAAPEVIDVMADGVASPTSAFLPLNMIQPAMKEENGYEKSPA
jgi:Fe-S cluster biogenesis protein NfuA